jgi:RNA polymerase sigma-70 factor (ECF subfamily)
METTQVPSDRQLLESYYAGNDGAMDVLYRRHHQSLIVFAARFLRNAEEAKEMAQEAFVKLMDSKMEEKPLGAEMNVRAWLYKVCARDCIDTLRKPGYRRRVDVADIEAIPQGTPLVFTLTYSQAMHRFPKCLKKLEEIEQTALMLRHFMPVETSNEELAEILRISPGYASKITTKAKTKLRNCLGL